MSIQVSSGRAELLDAAVEHVAANGIGERSLRQLAVALGTSHRMLIYHFGSKEGLLVEVVREVEQRQRDLLGALDQDDLSPRDVAERLWTRLTDTVLAPYERLFFEVYGRALQGDPASTPVLDGIVEAWIEPLAASMRRAGMEPDDARTHARLGVAVARGLLLDLLATGDRDAVDVAMDRFITLSGLSEVGRMGVTMSGRDRRGPRPLRVTTHNAPFQQWSSLLTNRTKRRRSGTFVIQGSGRSFLS